jgi:palmitoyltransferase ZDHHC9/14/18
MEPLLETPDELTPIKQQLEDDAEPEPAAEENTQESGRRSLRRASNKVATYNVQILAGTAIHTPTKYLQKHHKHVYRDGVVVEANTPSPTKAGTQRRETEGNEDPAGEQLATEVAEAAQRRRSSRVDLRKEAIRNKMAAAGSSLAKKSQDVLSSGKDLLQQALRGGTADTREETGRPSPKSPAKRARGSNIPEPEQSDEESEEEKEYVKPKVKKWEEHGLYVGQHREFNPRLTESANRQKRRSLQGKENKTLPLPMYAGERLLCTNPRKEWRDFKLPFDTFSPLPKKVKVDGWVKLSKNRFVGDASSAWKKDKPNDGSKCYCSPEDGCGVSCHNRSMLYECDSTNCNLTAEECGNRPFAELKKRAKGNRFDYGVEVVDTEDRGFGVRAMRTFEPFQIIVEYAGEIITQGECERRMKHEYKKNQCYYLMSFDNKTIIDATRGTIARFVNHSCEPNCEMIKWTVNGEPRMALFAGSRGIMTGEELTYDYNFDPFSSKNIQECKCGTRSCRGVLGPKPKDQGNKKTMAASLFAGTKRKLQEAWGTKGSRSAPSTPTKRRRTSDMGTSALTKAFNSEAEAAASRAMAEKKAAEEEAQRKTREERALRRSSSTVTITTKRTKELSKQSRASLPSPLKSVKKTTVSVVRSSSRPGQLRPVNKAAKPISAVRRHMQTLKEKTGLLSKPSSRGSTKTSSKSSVKSPVKSVAKSPTKSPMKVAPVSPDIAITASSLRSSTSKLKQSKLNFKPVALRESRDSSSPPPSRPYSPVVWLSDDDDDDYSEAEIESEFAAVSPAPKTAATPKSVRSAAASAKQTIARSVRGGRRAAAVAKAGVGLGFSGMGGLSEGGSGSTIRVITGRED